MEESFTYQEGQVMGWEANKPWGWMALLTLMMWVDTLNLSTFVVSVMQNEFLLKTYF